MYIPYTIIKNYTDEDLHYYIKMKNGGHRGEIGPNAVIEFTDVVVGDTLHLENDNYHSKYIIYHAMNPKYIISYEHKRINDMKENRGFNTIVLTRKGKDLAKSTHDLAKSTRSDTAGFTDNSSAINTKLFIGFMWLLIILIAILIGIIYFAYSGSMGFGGGKKKASMTSSIQSDVPKIMI